MLNVELQIEMRARRRAQRNHTREQEREPDPAIVCSWRRFYLRLERHSQSTEWFTTLNKSRQKGIQPDLCKHDDVTLLKNTANKFASQTFCQKCQKTIVYNHTKEGVITWMKTFQNLVVKNKIPPTKNGNGATLHPDDPDAYRYCKRCVHPMEPIQIGSGCRTWHQCSQHSANPPCNFARNGHLPPTSGSQSKAKQEKSKDVKKRLWLDHNTVVNSDNVKISGETINRIGQRYNGRTYMDILNEGPQYVSWAITTAPPGSEASIELKHMASFFLEANKCNEAFRTGQDSSSPPAPSSSTTQPTGRSSFVKPKAKSKSKTNQPPHFNMAGETSDDQEM